MKRSILKQCEICVGKILKRHLFVFVLAASCVMSPPVVAQDYPGSVKQLLSDALKFFGEGKYSSARMQFNEALKLEPNCPDAYNGLGLCAFKEGNIVESNSCYTTAITLKPDYYDALYNLGNNYYMRQQFSEAIVYYSRALKTTESKGQKADAALITSLANVYRDRSDNMRGLNKQQDMAHAMDYYHRVIKDDPNYPQAHAMLGRLYFNERQFPLAESELRKAISLQPEYAYAYFVLGKLYVQKKEYPAALVAFHNSAKYETISNYKPDTARAISDLGIPATVVDNFEQGFENLNLGNWDAGQKEFEAAAAASTPMKAIALNNVGYASARAGNMANAIDKYKRAIVLNPHGVPELYYNLGQAYFQTKRYTEAEEALKQCIVEAKGNHYLAHNALGILLKAKGDLNESLNQYNLALLQSGGGLSVVQFNRGLVLEKLGNKAEAAESYTKYLQAAPSGINVAEAKERLSHLK